MAEREFPNLITRRSFIRQAACAALTTAGITNAIRDLRFMNLAMAQEPITDYKAMVCIFLSGGNDSNNLIIPIDSTEYNNYRTIRGAPLALPNVGANGVNGSARELMATDAAGKKYGIHPACPELQQLFNNGKMAGVFNVGTLVYPLTKAQFTANNVARPPQLFSHGDQVAQWQTSIPDRIPTTGWGGRTADYLDILNPRNETGNAAKLSMSISVAGSNTFEVGAIAQQYAVSTSGVVSLVDNVGPNVAAYRLARNQAMKDLLGYDKTHENLVQQNYALALDKSIATGTALSRALESSELNKNGTSSYWNATYPKNVVVPNSGVTITNSSLMAQLKMIARVIEASYRTNNADGLGMKRQIFFCTVGGYDTHNGQTGNAGQGSPNDSQVIVGAHANLLAEVSQSVAAFQAALQKIGETYGDPNFENRVTSFTASDFSRNFPTNGSGCDHGWGGHHLVIGGGVKGKNFYGKFPALAVGGPDDTSAGRWIPTTSVDQFAATMAKWFGVSPSQMPLVFPNLSRFETPDLGFML